MGDKEPTDDFELPSQMLFSQMQRYFDNQYQNQVEQRVKEAEEDELVYVKTPPHNDNETTEDNLFNEISDDDTNDLEAPPDQRWEQPNSRSRSRESPILENPAPTEKIEDNNSLVEQARGSSHLYQSPVTTQQFMQEVNNNMGDNLSPITSKEINMGINKNDDAVEIDVDMDEIMAFIENNKKESKEINLPEIDLDLDPDLFVELMKDKLADVPLAQVEIHFEEIFNQKSITSTQPVNNVNNTNTLIEEKSSTKEESILPLIITSTPSVLKTPSQSDISNSTNDKTSAPDPSPSMTPIVQKMNDIVQSQIPVPENNIVLPYKLNEDQLKAVQSPFNIPLMIAAGPGSGTTSVVFYFKKR